MKSPTGFLQGSVGKRSARIGRNESDRTNSPDDVGTPKNSIELTSESGTVVLGQARLENWQRKTGILDDEGVEPNWRIVDVPDSHGENIDEEEERIARVDPFMKENNESAHCRDSERTS